MFHHFHKILIDQDVMVTNQPNFFQPTFQRSFETLNFVKKTEPRDDPVGEEPGEANHDRGHGQGEVRSIVIPAASDHLPSRSRLDCGQSGVKHVPRRNSIRLKRKNE